MARSTRPRRRRDHVAARLALALAASLLANGLFLWLAYLTGAFDLGRPVKVSQVALAPLSAEDWAKNRGAAAPAPPAPRPPPPQLTPPLQPQPDGGIVVKLPPGPDGKPPAESRFLAERDQSVERETVSRHAVGHDGPVLPAPQYPRNFSVAVNRQVSRSLGLEPEEDTVLRDRIQRSERE